MANKQDHSPGRGDSRPLRIAEIAPLYERVPPKLYGGTERVVSYLTEELVRRGHEVTLFASGDSITKAKLSPGYPTALRLAGKPELGTFIQLPMISDVYDGCEDRFDIIHSHIDYWSFPFARLVKVPTVATMHGRLDIEDLRQIYYRYRSVPAVSISDAQRDPLKFMNWVATIYHGLPKDLLHLSPAPGKYLAFLGRISPEKRPDLAIDIARKVGIPLKIAAKIDVVDRAYFEAVVEPRLSPPDVEYIGEINEVEKDQFLGNAVALLFPIDWPEPFGLTMIESMACGTPIVARPCGSVPEIIKPGVTGVIGSTVEELAAAVGEAAELSRAACRAEFEARFSVAVQADNYVALFRRLIAEASARTK